MRNTDWTPKASLRRLGCRGASIFNYRNLLVEKALEGLLSRSWAGARQAAVRGEVAEEFNQALVSAVG